MTHGRSNTSDFVGGDAGTYPAATDEDTALSLAVGNRPGDCFGEIGVVIVGVVREGADFKDVHSLTYKDAHQLVLEFESGVVGTKCDLRGCSLIWNANPTIEGRVTLER